MKIESNYPDLALLAQTLKSKYQFHSTQAWNGITLDVPDSIGNGFVHIFHNQGIQFMRGDWDAHSNLLFSSLNQVKDSNLIDFRINNELEINSAYLQGESRYEWDISNVNGFRFMLSKSIFNSKDIHLRNKFQKFCYHPNISDLVSKIISINPKNLQESIMLEWKCLEFAYYYIDFLNNKDISRHFEEIPHKHVKSTNKIKLFLDENYIENITIQKLARIAGMNIQYLKQRFKQLNNCTIRQYQIRLRMKHAREMVRYDSIAINEICQKVGYTNKSHFLKTYKKVFSISPTEDRKAYRIKISK